uniref:Unannotated protein n=1 Tax=freshwater metagenome TaxID=449393 RepID=A0A6J7PG64_9ZZZZ
MFHRRVRVARIRRVSVAVSGAAAVALIAVGAVALTGNERGNNITPMDPSITLDTVADPSTGVGASTTTTPTTTLPDDDTGPSSGSGPGATGTSGSGGTASIPSSGSTSTTVDDSDNSDESDESDESDDPDESDDSDDSRNEGSGNPRTTTSTGGRAATKRCSSAGGSFTASHLTKNSVMYVSPASGFSKTEQEIEDETITVVFADNEVEYHVVARWTGESFSCSVGS